jgi:hypothetical protein
LVREIATDLAERRREPEVHQAGRSGGGEHDVRLSDVAVHHGAVGHARDRTAELHGEPDQILDGEDAAARPGSSAGVIQHDRVGVAGSGTSCTIPGRPRSRSRIATSCRSRASAFGPSGSLQTVVRPSRDAQVKRV